MEKYSVICKWLEDNIEKWDVVDSGPTLYNEALFIAKSAGDTWDKTCPLDMKYIKHKEYIIKYEIYQEMIKSDEYAENIIKELKL